LVKPPILLYSAWSPARFLSFFFPVCATFNDFPKQNQSRCGVFPFSVPSLTTTCAPPPRIPNLVTLLPLQANSLSSFRWVVVNPFPFDGLPSMMTRHQFLFVDASFQSYRVFLGGPAFSKVSFCPSPLFHHLERLHFSPPRSCDKIPACSPFDLVALLERLPFCN